jgi:hypothetical protein
MYLSVKHGWRERAEANGRLFVDLNERLLRELFARFPDTKLIKVWLSGGEGAFRGKTEWINALAQKSRKSAI